MGLDVRLRDNHCDSCGRYEEVFSSGITHNLRNMASEAGIYQALWHPESIPITKARDLMLAISTGYSDLKARPEHYEKLNPPNGWGSYKSFLWWLGDLMDACEKYPNSTLEVST
jgi:hypothetical protein